MNVTYIHVLLKIQVYSLQQRLKQMNALSDHHSTTLIVIKVY